MSLENDITMVHTPSLDESVSYVWRSEDFWQQGDPMADGTHNLHQARADRNRQLRKGRARRKPRGNRRKRPDLPGDLAT
jgi:hypothetical protein